MTLSASVEVMEARRDELPERAQAALDLLTSDVSRFQGLVEDLLEISRFDAGAIRLHLEELPVAEFVRNAVAVSAGADDARDGHPRGPSGPSSAATGGGWPGSSPTSSTTPAPTAAATRGHDHRRQPARRAADPRADRRRGPRPGRAGRGAGADLRALRPRRHAPGGAPAARAPGSGWPSSTSTSACTAAGCGSTTAATASPGARSSSSCPRRGAADAATATRDRARCPRSRRCRASLGVALGGCGIDPDSAPRTSPPTNRAPARSRHSSDAGGSPGASRVFLVDDAGERRAAAAALRAARRADRAGRACCRRCSRARTRRSSSDGLRTALPTGTELLSARHVAGTLNVDLSRRDPRAAERGAALAVAQIVFTADELPGVDAVRLRVDGEIRAWPAGRRRAADRAADRLRLPGFAESAQPAYPAIPSDRP